jgi:two-component system response regulator DctR
MESSQTLEPLPVPVEGPIRILDDDEHVLRYLSKIVEMLGLRAEAHQCPAEFFAKKSKPPACVVVDWQLKDADGLEVVGRCQCEWPETPVILISGQATVSVAVSAMRQGVVGVLEKPVTPAALRRELALAIEIGRQRAEAIRQRQDAQARIATLTELELTVLKLLVQGTPNKNIASHMDLAMRTVEKYRRALFDKLGVDSAAEAARVWTLANLDE